MLLQFSVKNFKSFKEEAVLSMEASFDKELNNNLTVVNKTRCLNTVAIFGANASGKSNVFEALTSAIMLVRRSNARQAGEPMSEIIPFKFNEESVYNPTEFEFVFFEEGKKYVYGFSATQNEVQSEYLYVYKSAKASTVFERTEVSKYKFTSPALKREMQPFIERNKANKLFLATACNCEETRIPYHWFETKINTYSTNFEQLFYQNALMFSCDEDNSLRRFSNHLLSEADINIDDFELEIDEVTKENITKDKHSSLSTIPVNLDKNIKIDMVHTVVENDVQRRYKLPLQEESKGTRNLFLLSPVLKNAFEKGGTICIDEFDSSLHPILVRYLFSLFNNADINKANAQLIVSCHALELMSLKIMRRDQIFFTEKDRKTSASELFSLDEFSPRKEEDVRKAYMLGRYGSIPYVSE